MALELHTRALTKPRAAGIMIHGALNTFSLPINSASASWQILLLALLDATPATFEGMHFVSSAG